MAVSFDVEHYDANFDDVGGGREYYNDVGRGIFIVYNVKRWERRTEVGNFISATFFGGRCD